MQIFLSLSNHIGIDRYLNGNAENSSTWTESSCASDFRKK